MKTRIALTRFAALATGIIFTFSSCKKEEEKQTVKTNYTADHSHEVATAWMGLVLKMSQENPGFTPPVAARAFGYTGLALYESVRQGMPGYKSMAGQVSELEPGMVPQATGQEYHWGAVANAALATIVRSCYDNASPANAAAIDNLEQGFVNNRFKNETSADVLARSQAFGKAVGEAIANYAASDSQGHCYESNFPVDYTPPSGPGLWVPTPPAYQIALQPYWGDVRPFLSKNITETIPAAPPAYSTDTNSDFGRELMEVYHAVKNLTPAQELVAKYWSDDPGNTATPPGHSLNILKQVLENENANLATSAEAFAKLGMAVHDAFISCWKCKYTYNLVRPITYIHSQIDPNFQIPLVTPPFPEYTSGHSVQSGAAAQVLTDLFGANYAFTDYTHQTRTDMDGSPRSFSSFFDFADEAAISRLYGGIHYRAAIELGIVQGKQVGSNIGNLDFK